VVGGGFVVGGVDVCGGAAVVVGVVPTVDLTVVDWLAMSVSAMSVPAATVVVAPPASLDAPPPPQAARIARQRVARLRSRRRVLRYMFMGLLRSL